MNTISSELPVLNTTVSSPDGLLSGPVARLTELDRKLRVSLETVSNVAEIVLTVTDFREVLHTRAADRGTLYKISMGKEHQHVFVDQSGDEPKLKIRKGAGSMTFKFTIVDPHGKETYYPLAISFKWHTSVRSSLDSTPNLHGRQNFPFSSMHVYDRNVYLTGFSMPQDKGIDYKFSAIFQREDAKIAIIDPGIENDNGN